MSDSIYRPSGARKGTHLHGQELLDRSAKREAAYAKHLDYARSHFHCSGDNCAATVVSITYGQRQVENAQLGMIWMANIATLTCEQGHTTEVRV